MFQITNESTRGFLGVNSLREQNEKKFLGRESSRNTVPGEEAHIFLIRLSHLARSDPIHRVLCGANSAFPPRRPHECVHYELVDSESVELPVLPLQAEVSEKLPGLVGGFHVAGGAEGES